MKSLAAALMVSVALVGSSAQARQDPAASRVAEASVTRDGAEWTVDYVLNLERPAFAFQVSALTREGRRAWRLDRWTVQTPGVVLERVGHYDVLRSVDGGPLPRHVRILMRPAGGDLEAEYSPSLVFSDGAVAMFTEQFDLLPLGSRDAALDLPQDLRSLGEPAGQTLVSWRDASGPVLFRGERVATAAGSDAGTYVYFGQGEAVGNDAVAAVFDPGLPPWINKELADFTPRVMAHYSARLGARNGARPTLMVSWSGPTEGVTSMAGSVLPDLVVMDFEGDGVLTPSREMLDQARWFIGHEAAHFWLGSQGLRYEAARDAWITEGGADLLAVRGIQALDPDYDGLSMLQKEVDDCLALSASGPVATAGERGEHRAFYACGAVWALAFESARKASDGGDWFDVLRDFREGESDGVLSREDWLGAFSATTREVGLRAIIERMLDAGSQDPAADLASLFDGTGVQYRREGARLVLL